MNNCIQSEITITADSQPKKSKYFSLINNPEILAEIKEHRKKMYEAQKKALKELEERGIIIEKPKSTHKKIDPEVKRKYNEKYYNTHKEQIIQSCNNYMRNERAKEHSPVIEKQREHLRKYYHEVVKKSPEQMELQRARARAHYQRKKEQLALAKANNEPCDSGTETSASSCTPSTK